MKKQRIEGTQQATSPVREPLIYELVFRRTASELARKLNLMIYDVSGEDYADQTRILEYSQYILNASAIIFLADPIAMPRIYDQLPAHLQSGATVVTGRRVSSVLNSIIRIYERNQKLASGSRLVSIPIAITISKSDLLKFFRPVSQPYSFSHNPMYDGNIHLRDLQTVDHEVKELIAEYGDPNLLLAARTFSNVHFFAASATGFSPDANGIYPDVIPCRCFDPLLWILWRLRFIDAV